MKVSAGILFIALMASSVLCAGDSPWKCSKQEIVHFQDFVEVCHDLWTRIDAVLAMSADTKQKNAILKECLSTIELIHQSLPYISKEKNFSHLETAFLLNSIQENFEAAFKGCEPLFTQAGTLFEKIKLFLKTPVNVDAKVSA